jgi:hypothetical protein
MNTVSSRSCGWEKTRRAADVALPACLGLLVLLPAANAQGISGRQQQQPGQSSPPVRVPPPPPGHIVTGRIIMGPQGATARSVPPGNRGFVPDFGLPFGGISLYPELPTAFNGGGRRYSELPNAFNGGGRNYPELPNAFNGPGLYPELPTAFHSGPDLLHGRQPRRSFDNSGFNHPRVRGHFFFHDGFARFRGEDVFITYGVLGIPDYAFYYPQWGGYYFPGNWAFYPYYYPSYIGGVTVISPYGIYYGVCPPYIGLNNVSLAPPQYIYVPVPVYTPDGDYQGRQKDGLDEYYLNKNQADRNRPSQDEALETAVSDIQKAWRNRDVDALSKHLPKGGKIAVTLRGKYQYSLEPDDYLDLTRDAFRTTKTVRFTLETPQFKENGVYTVTGRHVYEDKDGDQHTVYISYVLEKTDDEYVITQVGTAPDRIQEQQ